MLKLAQVGITLVARKPSVNLPAQRLGKKDTDKLNASRAKTNHQEKCSWMFIPNRRKSFRDPFIIADFIIRIKEAWFKRVCVHLRIKKRKKSHKNAEKPNTLIHPFTFPIGFKATTRLVIPAFSKASTTTSISL